MSDVYFYFGVRATFLLHLLSTIYSKPSVYILKYLIIILLCFNVVICKATHIVGGELNYVYLQNNKYKITLRLYIDCYNGQPGAIADDEFANIGVFAVNNNALLESLSVSIRRGLPTRVSKTNYNCIKLAPDACIDAYLYEDTITLPYLSGGYILSFQRCCRNKTILNLIDPEGTGINIFTQIPDTAVLGKNNNPVFRNLPPNFLCTNAPLIFDHSATDTEGDSLVYEFFNPFTGGTYRVPRPDIIEFELPPFTKVLYQAGYSYTVGINSAPIISLNKKTGLLKITPTVVGQFVVGIVVKEYRGGKLIGHTQRDYQFNVQHCVFETTSAFVTPDINCDREVRFNNTSQNATSYHWDFGDTATNKDTANTRSGYYKYPQAGKYRVKLVAANGNCADTLYKEIEILDNIKYKLPNDTFLCYKQTFTIAPSVFYKNAKYLWSDNSQDSIIKVSNAGQYWVSVTYGKCVKSDTFILTYDTTILHLNGELICNKNTKSLDGECIVSGAFKTINWYSNPKQIPQNYTGNKYAVTQEGIVKINGLKDNGCAYSDSITLKAATSIEIFKVPNVFTPNGDGINDYYPEFSPPYFYHLSIYDRWGLKVFEGDNTPWDSNNFPTGVYYYFIEANACALSNKTHGVVHIVR